MYIEPRVLKEVLAVSATTEAQDVAIKSRNFIIQNNAASGTYIYFKEKNGVAATNANAFRLDGGAMLDMVVSADTLSIISSGTASVIIMFLG